MSTIFIYNAFYSISHKTLLKKLFDYTFRGPLYCLLENVLVDRSQPVFVRSVCGFNILLKAGVPRGSLLSPRLFNLYLYDLPISLSDCNIFQYAETTLSLSQQTCLSDAVCLLQDESCRIMSWFLSNSDKINRAKTKFVCFHSPMKVAV